MPRDSSPTIRDFIVRAVRVSMTAPHQTASGTRVDWNDNAVRRFAV